MDQEIQREMKIVPILRKVEGEEMYYYEAEIAVGTFYCNVSGSHASTEYEAAKNFDYDLSGFANAINAISFPF